MRAAPTRLERVSQQIEAKSEDEDGGVLAGRDPAAEEEALRRAGKFLRAADEGRE